MQLKYLKKVSLKYAEQILQSNGSYLSNYKVVKEYNVQMQELSHEVSCSIYGANIDKILRIKSPRYQLEKYLATKLTNNCDNISKYFIFIDNIIYKIKSVKLSWIDIERI